MFHSLSLSITEVRLLFEEYKWTTGRAAYTGRNSSQHLSSIIISLVRKTNKLEHNKTNRMAYAPSKDSDQPAHPPRLIRAFAVRMKKAWVLSYPLSAQRRLWSDWVDAQADLSLRWAHMPFCWFCHKAAQMSWSTTKPTKWICAL